MSGKSKNTDPRFIELYRRKLRRELDTMGYPGGAQEETAVEVSIVESIIDAGSAVRLRPQDRGSKKRPLTVGR